MPTFFRKGKKQGCTSKGSQESCRFSDLQALTQADSGESSGFVGGADSQGECISFKGEDRHDTDGSLSLGSREASGRVDVPVSVTKLVDQAFRSPQSVVVNQSLRVQKTIFMKVLDGRTTSHRVSEGTMVWEILDDWMTGFDDFFQWESGGDA